MVLQKADWNKFQVACNQYISEPNTSDDIDGVYDNFIQELDSAMTCSIPKTNPNHHKTPTSWWNDDCKQAINNKKKALKTLRKTRLPSDLINYKRACAVAKKTINSAKRKDWEDFCNEINQKTNTKIIWNTIKRISKTLNANSIPVLNHNGTDAITDKDKVEALADSFSKVSSTKNYSPSFIPIKDKAEKDFCIDKSSDSVINEPFNMEELNHAIDSAKCTSPGKDGISNTVIKHFPINIRKYLLIIFNMIWYTSQCPKQWKDAILIPLLKPGKPSTNPLSYRPISLTSTLCKIMERMVNSRLLWYLETHNLLSNRQSGFRKGRSTKDHILNLESSINKESTLAVFLDIEKAYDMLWRKGIIIKLYNMGIYGRITKWIDNFLTDRKIQVKVNNCLSEERTLDNGVPQGSVISPLLLNIAVDDLSHHVADVNISQLCG